MATQIGFVKSIIGEVTAMGADGTIRSLNVGEQVFANELISTGPGSAIEIEFADGSVMDLGRNSQALLDNTVFDPDASMTAEQGDTVSDDIAAIQQALLEGQDPTQVGEATAAGAGVEGGNEGHEAVFVDYLNPAIIPDAGFDTIGVVNEYDLPEEDIIILPEEDEPAPPATVLPPTATVTVEDEGNVVLEDGSINVIVTAQAGDATDELTGVTITLPAGWTATIGMTVYSGTFTLPASGQSFSQVLSVTPGPEDSDVDGVVSVVAHARDISQPSLTATSAPDSVDIVVDTVLDEAVDVADGNNSGNESASVQVLSLNLNASTLSPYGQTDGAPADTTESGTATVSVSLPEGAVLGTWDGITFTALVSDSFTGTASEVAAWVNSLAVQVPAGFDGNINGSVSVTFTDTPTADGNPNTANDTYTDTADFSVTVNPGQLNPSANVQVGDEGNVVLEDGSINVTVTADAGDLTDELTGVTITLPDGWTATIGMTEYSGTFTLPASGQSFSEIMLVTPGPEDTDVDGVITAVAHAQDIVDNTVTADSSPAMGTVVIDTVLDEAVDVADGNNSGNESASVQVLSLNLNASTLSPYGQTDGAPADATESGTATVSVSLPAGAVLGTLDGMTFTALASNSFTGTGSEVAAWVNSLAVQVPAGFDGNINGSVSVTFTDTPTADGNPNTANDTYTDTATFSVTIADSVPSNPVNDSITVEEESIPGFNGNDESDGLSYTFTGTFADNANWGVDGFGSIVSVNGVAPDAGTITLNEPGGLWTLVVDADTGSYTFTLLKPMDSTPFGDDAEGTDILPVFNVIAADGDGSTIGFGLTVNVVDDIPVSLNPTTSHLKDMATSPDVIQLLNFAVGADGVGSVKFTDSGLQGTAAMDALGNPLSFNGTGEALFINFSADMTQLQFVTKNPDGTLNTSDVKFFIELNQDGLTYTVHSEGVISNGTAVSSATIETVGGGNKAWKAFINLGGTQEDALLTTKSGATVNTNNSQIGISAGNSFEFGEGLRIDFLNGVTTTGSGGNERFGVSGPHNLTNSFRQIVSFVGGNQNATANLTVTAIVANDFAAGTGTDADSHNLFYNDADDANVNLSVTDIKVYNTSGQLVTSGITLIDNGNSITINGLKQGWTFEINSATEFNAVQIEAAANTETFKLGVFSYGENSDGLPIELDYNIVGTDADGDAVTGSLDVNLYPAGSTFEGNEDANTLTGTSNADYLLGRGGNDILSGLGGDDLLIGGYGNDTLSGGTGVDTFVFSLAANSGNDTITDFTPGVDKLSFIDVLDTDGSTVIDLGDVISSVADNGANVTVNLNNGGSINLQGIGNGTVDTVAELQALLGPANITVEQS
jgi:hypothetical protein